MRETGRNAAGVKLIRVDDGDKLVAMAKLEKVEEAAKDANERVQAAADAPAVVGVDAVLDAGDEGELVAIQPASRGRVLSQVGVNN